MSSADTTYLQLFLANTLNTTLDKHWIVDSGATAQTVKIGNGNTVLATAIGHVTLNMHLLDGKTGRIALQTVYYVPGLRVKHLFPNCRQQNHSHPANILNQTPSKPNFHANIPAVTVVHTSSKVPPITWQQQPSHTDSETAVSRCSMPSLPRGQTISRSHAIYNACRQSYHVASRRLHSPCTHGNRIQGSPPPSRSAHVAEQHQQGRQALWG